MSDIIFEIIRAVILLYVVLYLVRAGARRKELCRKGWSLIIAGFGLLLFANIMDVTDNFESLNRFVVIGDTPTQAFLEKMVGFMGGFLLLAIGLIRWIPTITGVHHSKQLNEKLQKEIIEHKEAEKKLCAANRQLESEMTERKQAEEELQETLAEIDRFNKLMIGREGRVIEMKKEVNALLAELGRQPQYKSMLEDETIVSSDKAE